MARVNLDVEATEVEADFSGYVKRGDTILVYGTRAVGLKPKAEPGRRRSRKAAAASAVAAPVASGPAQAALPLGTASLALAAKGRLPNGNGAAVVLDVMRKHPGPHSGSDIAHMVGLSAKHPKRAALTQTIGRMVKSGDLVLAPGQKHAKRNRLYLLPG